MIDQQQRPTRRQILDPLCPEPEPDRKQQLKDLLVNLHGFKIIQEHGPVVYFGRP